MQPSVPDIVARAAYALFGRPLVHQDFLCVVVEAIVASALSPEWSWRPANGDPGTFVHQDGSTLGVKAIAVLDHRTQHRTAPLHWWLGRPMPGHADPLHRDPSIFVLALHPEVDPAMADHRDATQWRFFAYAASTCEGRIATLADLQRKGPDADIGGLAAAVTWAQRSLDAMRRDHCASEACGEPQALVDGASTFAS